MKPALILLEKRVSFPPGAALGRQEHGALLCELADDLSLLESKKKSGEIQRNKKNFPTRFLKTVPTGTSTTLWSASLPCMFLFLPFSPAFAAVTDLMWERSLIPLDAWKMETQRNE